MSSVEVTHTQPTLWTWRPVFFQTTFLQVKGEYPSITKTGAEWASCDWGGGWRKLPSRLWYQEKVS